MEKVVEEKKLDPIQMVNKEMLEFNDFVTEEARKRNLNMVIVLSNITGSFSLSCVGPIAVLLGLNKVGQLALEKNYEDQTKGKNGNL